MVFDDRDGGSNGYTITYQGAPNLGTRIYGGRRITNWTQVNCDAIRGHRGGPAVALHAL